MKITKQITNTKFIQMATIKWFKKQPKGDQAMLIFILIATIYFGIGVLRVILQH